MAWMTLPQWGAAQSPPISRQAALKLVPRIAGTNKKVNPAGWLIREGTAKPEARKPGPKPGKPKAPKPPRK